MAVVKAARVNLLSVLEARQLQLWMRQTLRELHKSPYLREGEWEQMFETYRACFPERVDSMESMAVVKRRNEARAALLRVLKERAWCMRLARALLEAQGLAR